VLAYHRIANPNDPGFDTFKPNVSATPDDFAAQIDFIRERFNVISQDDLVAWLQNQQPLPPYPALITFDDGYRDNFDHAFPVLQNRKLPAIIFLATNYINHASPFYCDLISYCFYHTRQTKADLPLSGWQEWHDESGRTSIMDNWLSQLKILSDDEKWAAIKQLPHALGVTVPDDAFAGLHLTWDQVRTMAANGIDMGAHTQSHPILTRVSVEQARREITGSKAQIEAEINRPVTTFAYPNGTPPDFNPTLQDILIKTGFEAAFTLVPGPTRPSEVRQTPMAIRRIFIHHKDSLPRFAAKVMGLPRLLGQRA
jgi:peptidoglycan/xylan/chitin deacetylase (PgdA/CDA1 family)